MLERNQREHKDKSSSSQNWLSQAKLRLFFTLSAWISLNYRLNSSSHGFEILVAGIKQVSGLCLPKHHQQHIPEAGNPQGALWSPKHLQQTVKVSREHLPGGKGKSRARHSQPELGSISGPAAAPVLAPKPLFPPIISQKLSVWVHDFCLFQTLTQ